MELLERLVHTFVYLRPYVLGFFLIYLLGCSLHLGLLRAALFAPVGYLIAWLSEYSSIHTGIPYGLYYYVESTRGQEVWVLGVPLMDSLSYVFLAYASYSLALIVLSPVLLRRGMLYLLESRRLRGSWSARTLGALLFTYLDIIIDPVALRGDRWFLGKIYGYPEEGVYFGVPISNFIGWAVVGFLLIYALQKIDAFLQRTDVRDLAGLRRPWRYLIGPLLYLGVLVFNLSVTFAIGEYTLGWAGLFITLLLSALLVFIIRAKLSTQDVDRALAEHLRDFPGALVPRPPGQ